ncbi:hypothetical protein GCM10007417_27140 [Glycocaulis alkaliphilus]|nr:hypothetical protein GCM10007417_27140 [Glycocaulis alkaliphilus]
MAGRADEIERAGHRVRARIAAAIQGFNHPHFHFTPVMPGHAAREAAQKDVGLMHVFSGEGAGRFMFKLGQPFQYPTP